MYYHLILIVFFCFRYVLYRYYAVHDHNCKYEYINEIFKTTERKEKNNEGNQNYPTWNQIMNLIDSHFSTAIDVQYVLEVSTSFI